MNTSTNIADIPHWKNKSLENLKGEVWKNIPFQNGFHQISNKGRLKRIYPKLEIRTQGLCDRGYCRTRFKNKIVKTHTIVGQVFLGYNKETMYPHFVVDHIKNKRRFDNSVDNLQIISKRLNSVKDRKFKKGIFVGTCKKGNKFLAIIVKDKKQQVIGSFNTRRKASLAYWKAFREEERKSKEILNRLMSA